MIDPPHAPHGEGDRGAQRRGGGVVHRARELRKSMSLPEVLLWRCLRRRSLGFKFRRQYPFAPYVLDFYCAEARLAVEIDGEAHSRGDRPQRDAVKDQFLKERGLNVIRVAAAGVLSDPEAVAEAIVASVDLPLHRPAGGPPPHARHGEDRIGAP